MPTYEYVCKSCGERLEVFQSFRARPLRTHDDCGGELQKVFHARGVVFKGSGFYVTDNRRNSSGSNTKKTEKKTEEPAKAESSSVSDAAGD